MNYYKKIAEMLGVELGEEFSVKDCRTKEQNARWMICGKCLKKVKDQQILLD